MATEVELRSFITKEKYGELLGFFRKNGTFVREDEQETHYFDGGKDLRIQKNNFYSKVWMKKGLMHDEAREELEIKFDKDDFEKLEELFLSLGFKVQIKWFRTRNTFKWEGVTVDVDYTKGYGYVLELEKESDEDGKTSVLSELRRKIEKLGIPLTPREEFDKKFKDYKENWQKMVMF